MPTPDLKQSGAAMQIMGWALIIGLPVMTLLYPPGMLWGSQPDGFPSLRSGAPGFPVQRTAPIPFHGWRHVYRLGHTADSRS